MANDFIAIKRTDANAIEAAELIAYVNLQRQAYELGTRVRAKMRHAFDDSGGANAIDWATVQTLWGIPAGGTNIGPTASGAIVFTLIDGSVGAMEGTFQNSDGTDITERVG